MNVHSPFTYVCQQGCGEVTIFGCYTDRDGTHYHYHDGARHTVTRELRDEKESDGPQGR